jgi:hypothetical protein
VVSDTGPEPFEHKMPHLAQWATCRVRLTREPSAICVRRSQNLGLTRSPPKIVQYNFGEGVTQLEWRLCLFRSFRHNRYKTATPPTIQVAIIR